MPKKITIASGIALSLLAGIILFIARPLTGKDKFATPKRVSVYLPDAGEIVTLDYEEFLAGCVRGMLPNGAYFATEGLKAAAVAVNSRVMYAMSEKNGFQNLGADFTVGSDFPYVSEESFGGMLGEKYAEQLGERLEPAVRSAKGIVLTYEGLPINAQTCKISCGITDDSPPVSTAVSLPCDISAKGFESRFAFTPDEVRLALYDGANISSSCKEWLHDPVYADSGTLTSIKFCGKRITGKALKDALGLRSTAISVEYAEDKFYFTCLGLGENRGMSVNAANYLAISGSSAEEILAIFYPNAELKRVHINRNVRIS